MSTAQVAAALGFPAAALLPTSTNDTVSREIRRYVAFLEHRIIRFHPASKRNVCDDSIVGDKWIKIFVQYLQDLGCPFSSSGSLDVQLQWLSGNAAAAAFEDLTKDEICAESQREAALKNPGETKISKNDTSAFDEELQKLAQKVNVDMSSAPLDYAKRLLAVHTIEGAVQRLSARGNAEIVEHLNSGLDVDSEQVNRAAVIVRMLQLEEMRIVQNQINSCLETAQEFVSNPKTDSSLGRVGR
jgi:hypothetical protein